ncbi:MAG: ABC transporter permease [Defluviitaleaceae bacterium]|nr:ABC transporter permease [Defluviitaleaceae bacterium]
MVSDIKAMFWRSWLNILRTPEAVVISIVIPAIVMLVFINVFGGSMDVGGYNYANFIVPGILVNVLVQSSSATGVGVNEDMTKGIFLRFRSMAISSPAFLLGHVIAAFLKTILTTTITIGVAFIAGFRPTANFSEWLVIIGLIVLFILAITWFSVWLGVVMPDASSVSGVLALTAVLVFLSPGMAPTENMPKFLRYFAENQPMAPFITSLRALMNSHEIPDNDLLLTILWWGGILLLTFIVTIRAYKKKLTI